MTKVFFGGLSFNGTAESQCECMARAAHRWPQRSFVVQKNQNAWLGQLVPNKTDQSPSAHWSVQSMWESASSAQDESLASIANVDTDQSKVELRSGLTPIFYGRNDTTLLFASDPTLVRAGIDSTPTIDRSSALCLLISDHVPHDRSLFEQIQQLSPFTRLSGDRHGWSSPKPFVDAWVDRIVGNAFDNSSLSAAADRLESVVSEAVGDESQCILPLTGGVDSRGLLAAAQRLPDRSAISHAEQNLMTYTRGDHSDREVRTAAMLARKCGLPHHCYPFPASYLEQSFPRIVHLTGGTVAAHHGHGIHPLQELIATGRTRVLPGTNGEFGRAYWSASRFGNAPTEDAFRHQMIRKTFKTTVDEIRPLLSADLRSQVDETALSLHESFFQQLPIAGLSTVAALDLIYLLRRVARFMIWGPYLWSSGLEVRMPFLDATYLKRIAALPDSLRGTSELCRSMIARHSPQLMGIPLEPTGRRIDTGKIPIARRIRRKIERVSGRERHSPQAYDHWLRAEHKYVEELLSASRMVDAGLIDKNALRKCWSEHLLGKNHASILCKLLTIELSLRVVRDQEPVQW
ncbi:MAG: asparagine synthetase B family protein [Rubripirellula sp.]|nr:asparagine synthetase B family protein [Rubripirellula sp.]